MSEKFHFEDFFEDKKYRNLPYLMYFKCTVDYKLVKVLVQIFAKNR